MLDFICGKVWLLKLLSICPNGSLSFSIVIQSLKLALVSPLKVFNYKLHEALSAKCMDLCINVIRVSSWKKQFKIFTKY